MKGLIMTKKLLLLLSVAFSLSLQADCNSYTLLGSKQKFFNHKITTQNTIVWDNSNNNWSASQPLDKVDPKTYECQKSGYLLVNENEIPYKATPYTKDFYNLKKGWNTLVSHKDGIDILKTFSQYEAVKFVYVYDNMTKVWAGYSPDKKIQNSIFNTRILALKSIEPDLKFYVYTTKSIEVDIKTNALDSTCQKLVDDKRMDFLVDSGLDSDMVYNADKSMGLKSRYVSHYKRGIYDDSRVMLIYPKMKTKSKPDLKYGPAIPKTQMEFSKEYEGIVFFMYDYKQQKCYQGLYPSIKIPPFATLKQLK
jgi:hypothetical protein